MGTANYDAINTIITILNDNWTAGRVPNIEKSWEKRSVGFIDDRRDQIIITPKAEDVKYFSLYGTDHFHDVTVDFDIRTYQNDDRHNNVVKEAMKILKDKIRGGDDYVDLRIIASYTRNQYMRNMFNHIVTVSLRKMNPS
tara:strand:- start:68 stop:487 length:420 start_codon:yes stop_codon:yes gene_type:complete